MVGLSRSKGRLQRDVEALGGTQDHPNVGGQLPSARHVRRTVFFGCTLLVLTFFTVGCGRAAKPAEEKVPPAPVKWEAAQDFVFKLLGHCLSPRHRLARMVTALLRRGAKNFRRTTNGPTLAKCTTGTVAKAFVRMRMRAGRLTDPAGRPAPRPGAA